MTSRLRHCGTLWVVVVMLLTACGERDPGPRAATVDDPADRYVALARERHRAGDDALAVAALTHALRSVPERDELILWQARILLKHDPVGARLLADRVLERRPSDPEAWSIVARADVGLGDLAGGLAIARRELAMHEGHGDLHFALAHGLLARAIRFPSGESPADAREAIEHFRRAAAAPVSIPAWRAWFGAAIAQFLFDPAGDQALEYHGRALRSLREGGAEGESERLVRRVPPGLFRDRPIDVRAMLLSLALADRAPDPETWLALELSEANEELTTALETPETGHESALESVRRFLRDGAVRRAARRVERLAGADDDPAVLELLAEVHLAARDGPAFDRILSRLERSHAARPETLRTQARKALARSRPGAAERAIRTFSSESRDPVLVGLHAAAALRAGDLHRARESIDRLFRLPAVAASGRTALSHVDQALSLRARMHAASRDHRAAERDLWRVWRLRALTPDERLVLAEAWDARGKWREARQLLEVIAAGDPPHVGALVFLARREEQERAGSGGARLRRHLVAGVDDLSLVETLARIEAVTTPERAIETISRRIGDPASGYERLLVLRADILLGLGRIEEAREDLHRALRVAPASRQAISLLVALHTEDRAPEESIALLHEADRVGSLSEEGRVVLSELLQAMGEDEEAEQQLERVLAVSDSPVAKVRLAEALLKRGSDAERAHRLAADGVAAFPDDAKANHVLGWALLQRGLVPASVAQLARAADLAGANGAPEPTYFYRLGLALRRDWRNRSAAAAFEAALRVPGAFGQAEEARSEMLAARAGLAVHSGGSR